MKAYDINVSGLYGKVSDSIIDQLKDFVLTYDIEETNIIDINGCSIGYNLIGLDKNKIRGIFDTPFDMKNVADYSVEFSYTTDHNNIIISVEYINIVVKRLLQNDNIIAVDLSEYY